MDAKLTKSLTDLIDETLQELEELRKSRFSATEIKLEGPGKGIAGKSSDGDLHAKSEDKEDDEEEKEMDKAEEREEDKEEKEDEDEEKSKSMKKKEDKEDDEEDEDEEEKKDKKHPYKKETAEAAKEILDMHKSEMKKSLAESESLLKSYVDERVKPIEDKLSTILDLVNQIAQQPVAPKGVTARTAPLLKSADEGYTEPLSKAEVANKLLELKKSGTKVDSLDIVKVEMGQDLAAIMRKYELK